MSQVTHHGITPRQFYDWVKTVDEKYELVDGQPVMMAGATNRHDRIARNALRHAGNQLDGQTCQPFTADIYIAIPAGNRRQGDMGIDCGTPEDESMEADKPVLVMEILSLTTRGFDWNDKLEEYKTVPTLEYILLVDPDFPQVRVYYRLPDRRWDNERHVGLDAVLNFPELHLPFSLQELYAGVSFQPRPMLYQQ